MAGDLQLTTCLDLPISRLDHTYAVECVTVVDIRFDQSMRVTRLERTVEVVTAVFVLDLQMCG